MGKKIQYIGRYLMDGKTLGKGNFARVELATHGITKCKVAIKIIDTRKIKESYVRKNLHREARILSQLHHPNIVRLYETLKWKQAFCGYPQQTVRHSLNSKLASSFYCLVLEYASGGELLSYVRSHKDSRLTESQAWPFIRQLISALCFLHERGVVHRDLKMENILLDERKRVVKIVDFGLSNIYKSDEPLKTHCGSPEYAAPELFVNDRTYGPEVDIWSLGINMYALVVGKLPFTAPFQDEYRRQKLLKQIQRGLVSQHAKDMTHLTPDCRSLLRQLIEADSEVRLPLQEVEMHPWVTKNSRIPFHRYQAQTQDKAIRAQVVEHLSTAMDLDVSSVDTVVNEFRSDELSAMFNMMLDHQKYLMGIDEHDHTVRRHSRRSSFDSIMSGSPCLTPELMRTMMSGSPSPDINSSRSSSGRGSMKGSKLTKEGAHFISGRVIYRRGNSQKLQRQKCSTNPNHPDLHVCVTNSIKSSKSLSPVVQRTERSSRTVNRSSSVSYSLKKQNSSEISKPPQKPLSPLDQMRKRFSNWKKTSKESSNSQDSEGNSQEEKNSKSLSIDTGANEQDICVQMYSEEQCKMKMDTTTKNSGIINENESSCDTPIETGFQSDFSKKSRMPQAAAPKASPEEDISFGSSDDSCESPINVKMRNRCAAPHKRKSCLNINCGEKHEVTYINPRLQNRSSLLNNDNATCNLDEKLKKNVQASNTYLFRESISVDQERVKQSKEEHKISVHSFDSNSAKVCLKQSRAKSASFTDSGTVVNGKVEKGRKTMSAKAEKISPTSRIPVRDKCKKQWRTSENSNTLQSLCVDVQLGSMNYPTGIDHTHRDIEQVACNANLEVCDHLPAYDKVLQAEIVQKTKSGSRTTPMEKHDQPICFRASQLPRPYKEKCSVPVIQNKLIPTMQSIASPYKAEIHPVNADQQDKRVQWKLRLSKLLKKRLNPARSPLTTTESTSKASKQTKTTRCVSATVPSRNEQENCQFGTSSQQRPLSCTGDSTKLERYSTVQQNSIPRKTILLKTKASDYLKKEAPAQSYLFNIPAPVLVKANTVACGIPNPCCNQHIPYILSASGSSSVVKGRNTLKEDNLLQFNCDDFKEIF